MTVVCGFLVGLCSQLFYAAGLRRRELLWYVGLILVAMSVFGLIKASEKNVVSDLGKQGIIVECIDGSYYAIENSGVYLEMEE